MEVKRPEWVVLDIRRDLLRRQRWRRKRSLRGIEFRFHHAEGRLLARHSFVNVISRAVFVSKKAQSGGSDDSTLCPPRPGEPVCSEHSAHHHRPVVFAAWSAEIFRLPFCRPHMRLLLYVQGIIEIAGG